MPQSPESQGCVSFVSEIQNVRFVNAAAAATLTFFVLFQLCNIFELGRWSCFLSFSSLVSKVITYKKESDEISEEKQLRAIANKEKKMKIGNCAFREQ